MITIFAAISPAVARAAATDWRAVEGVWRVVEGDERCPGNEAWTYAVSDNGANLVFWSQGFLREPITIPDRLGNPPRIQGRAPFYNTRILSRGGNRLRNRHETLTVAGDRLIVDYGNFRCQAVRVIG
jgi:hypothetical protein